MTDSSWPTAPGYQPGYPGQPDFWAPFGRHPATGQPYSDRSKVVAALLQLLGLFGFLGFGRIYLGQTRFGIAQLLGCLAFAAFTLGLGGFVASIWGVVDAILILSGNVRDRQGRVLR